MIGMTPEQYAQRKQVRLVSKLKVCRKCRTPKENIAHNTRVCRDCLNEQRRRERARNGRITMVGKQPKRGRK